MIYFASDFHLGMPDYRKSREREQKIIKWLESIENNATDIFLLGDIFEFWFEWKYVVPKYFIRFLGKLAQLSDKGIKIHYFAGNHDLWLKDYFHKELNFNVYLKPTILTLRNKRFFIAHGDGLSPKEKNYRLVKKYIFLNPIINWIFGRILHPDTAFKIAMKFSDSSCAKTPKFDPEKEPLVNYAANYAQRHNIDYFVIGHIHVAQKIKLNPKATMLILGDWLKLFTYAMFDGENIYLKTFNI